MELEHELNLHREKHNVFIINENFFTTTVIII